jgi:hypothetical protein
MHTLPILDRLVVVNLDVRIWSGRKKLTADDLALGADVPPEDLVSLGSKRVCDPAPLSGFHRLKKQAERICLAGGTRFLSGFAIPQALAEAVAKELDALAARFAAQRATFVANYASAVDDWIAQQPRWEAAIRRAVDRASLVESRLAFGYQLYAITPPRPKPAISISRLPASATRCSAKSPSSPASSTAASSAATRCRDARCPPSGACATSSRA